jgi:hypothetical protein
MLRIEQSSSSLGPSYWKWSVWLEGGNEELARISEVRYQLHPTFSEPVKVIKNRETKFRLDASGWGEFAIYATITQNDGSAVRLQHWLRFGEGAPSKDDLSGGISRQKASRPQVFISHGATDSTFAGELHRALEERGMVVARLETLGASSKSPMDAIREVIEEVPVGIVLVSKQNSPWVVEEAKSLLDNNSLVIPVLLSSGSTPLHKLLEGLQSVHLQEGAAVTDSAEQVADQTAIILRRQGLL